MAPVLPPPSLASSAARYYFVGGKGGVGKTTTAAALASYFSRSKKTLVVSTDPAHSLADAFHTKLGGNGSYSYSVGGSSSSSGGSSSRAGSNSNRGDTSNGNSSHYNGRSTTHTSYTVPVPQQLCPNRPLYGLEIDPQASLNELKAALQISQIREAVAKGEAGFGFGAINSFVDAVRKSEIGNGLDKLVPIETDLDKLIDGVLDQAPPGLDEALAISQLLKYGRMGEYEKIVIDTAPTGHTLRLLSFPKFVLGTFPVLGFLNKYLQPSNFVGQMMQQAIGVDQLLKYLENSEKRLMEVQKDMEQLNAKLTDPKSTEFVVVATPSKLAVDETSRLLKTLKENQVPNSFLVVNQMPSPPVGRNVMDALNVMVERPELAMKGSWYGSVGSSYSLGKGGQVGEKTGISSTGVSSEKRKEEPQKEGPQATSKGKQSKESPQPIPPIGSELPSQEEIEELRSSFVQLREECRRHKRWYIQAHEYLAEMQKGSNVTVKEIPVFETTPSGLKGLEMYEKALFDE